MSYIHRLPEERDHAHVQSIRMQGGLVELQAYLASAKFQGIDNDGVSAREMWNRVQEIRLGAW